MRNWLFVFFIILVSCNATDTQTKILEIKEKELSLKEQELKFKEDSIRVNSENNRDGKSSNFENTVVKSATKFVYCVFEVKEPYLESHTETTTKQDPVLNMPDVETVGNNLANYNYFVMSSDIAEIDDYNEDKGYQYMDKQENSLNQTLPDFDVNYTADVLRHAGTEEERDRLLGYKSGIVDKKLKVFDTYKEASIYKEHNKTVFK